MSETLTNGEIARQLADLRGQVADGFRGTHVRLDKVNGQLDTHREKLGEHATALAEHRVKLSTLNNHIFRRRQNGETSESEPSRPITRWDLTVAGGGLYLLIEVAPKLAAMFKGLAP